MMNVRTSFLFLSLLSIAWACGITRVFEPQGATEKKALNSDDGDKNTKSSTGSVDQASTEATEPVSVAGAYLTCNYEDNQLQNGAAYALNCAVEGGTSLAPGDVQANFTKVDGLGKSYPLVALLTGSEVLKWKITETAETISIPRLEAKISIRGFGVKNFVFNFKKPLPLKLDLNLWMVGEPNNGDGGPENCGTMYNQAQRLVHANRYGPSLVQARFNDRNCDNIQRFICRKASPGTGEKWKMSIASGIFADYLTACPAGYKFGMPMSPLEMTEVNTLIDAVTAAEEFYVALTDEGHEGTFTFLFP